VDSVVAALAQELVYQRPHKRAALVAPA
jgi:hypothetical protein